MGQIIKIPPKIEDTLFSRLKSNLIEVYDNDNTTLREFIDHNGFKQVRYRDEYVGGEWVDALGAAAPNLVDVTIGGVATRKLSFNGTNTEERKSNSFEIAHDIDIAGVNNGTVKMEWHTHFMPSDNNTGDVKWFFDWCYKPANGSPIPMTSLNCIKTIPLNSIHKHFICGVEMPVPEGGFGIGGIIEFMLRRTPTDNQDTYESIVLLDKTALHVPTNDFGSRERYIK